MENILEVRNLAKQFNNFALKNINFELKKGFIMGFIGPNGAGKSTTIKCIMNLMKPDSGEINVFGKTHEQDTKAIKQRIGFVYDESYFYEDLSIEQNKRIIAPFYDQWNDTTFYQYIKKFDLPTRQQVKKLSKGMKVKFALAVALSHNPDLIIMDEPTSGLDPVFRRELLDLLLDIIQDEEKGVFFSTHITTDLEQVADYITFIHNGEIVFSTEKDTVLENYAVVKGANELLPSMRTINLIGLKETSVGFEGLLKNKEQISGELLDSLIIERPSLEDIMYYTVRGN